MASKLLEKDTSSLYFIKQRLGKPLRDYLVHFFKVALKIPKLDQGVALHVVIQGADLLGDFFKSLAKSKPTSLDQFLEKAKKYIIQEDNI